MAVAKKWSNHDGSNAKWFAGSCVAAGAGIFRVRYNDGVEEDTNAAELLAMHNVWLLTGHQCSPPPMATLTQSSAIGVSHASTQVRRELLTNEAKEAPAPEPFSSGQQLDATEHFTSPVSQSPLAQQQPQV